MPIETDYQRYEPEETGPYELSKVRVFFMCNRCGHEFSRIYRAVPKDDAPCPRKACQEAVAAEDAAQRDQNIIAILETGQVPGIAGRNPMNAVIDATAEITMDMYGMTDLKDNIREGESMAPSLPGNQQVAADNFFKAGAGSTGMSKKQTDLIGRRALSGAYRNLAVAPTDVFPGQKGESALWHVPERQR